MSLVKYLPEKPLEGSVVYADNGKFSEDIAVYEKGQFIGGGNFPVEPYIMSYVSKWFYMKEYDGYYLKSGKRFFDVSFENAEEIEL